MICFGRSSVCKVLSSGALAILLMCAPMQLAAQEAVREREAPTVVTGSVLEWFAGLWSDVTAWFTGGVVPRPEPPPPQSTPDNGCAIDPNGGCGG